MARGESENKERRAVEALAQALYEANDPVGVGWARRTRIVREPWLLRAQKELAQNELAQNELKAAEGSSQ